MTCKYELAIFDLDGTLLDTSIGILASAKFAIEQMGLDMPDESILETFIGPPIQNSFAKTFDLTDKEVKKMANLFREQYKSNDLLKAVEYEGIFEAIDILLKNNIKTAVATYKRQDYAEILLSHFGFDRCIEIFCGSDFEGKLTKSDIILNSIKEAQVDDYSKVIMVGDTHHDGLGAETLGVDFLAVTFGFGYKKASDVIEKNTGIANSPLDIAKIIFGEK